MTFYIYYLQLYTKTVLYIPCIGNTGLLLLSLKYTNSDKSNSLIIHYSGYFLKWRYLQEIIFESLGFEVTVQFIFWIEHSENVENDVAQSLYLTNYSLVLSQ